MKRHMRPLTAAQREIAEAMARQFHPVRLLKSTSPGRRLAEYTTLTHGEHEVESQAYLGLIFAARSYHPNKGYSMSSWAYYRVFESVRRVLRSPRQRFAGGSNGVSIYHDIGNGLTLKEIIPDRPNPPESRIGHLVDSLPEQCRSVISLRYGYTDGSCYKMSEVAKIVGISPARVCQIEQLAIELLRERIRPSDL